MKSFDLKLIDFKSNDFILYFFIWEKNDLSLHLQIT